MPSPIFVDRVHKLAEHLGDNVAKGQIERYLRQSDFVGPVVTFIGAEGRGKSTLFGKAAQVTPSSSAKTQFAGGMTWKKPVNEMAVPGSIFHSADKNAVGETLLCDAPSFGTVDHDKIVSSLQAITDLAIFAVQITQPAGMEEIAFVQKHLGGTPSVLVLTKCDQVDEDDFQEGVEAILENYGGFPWLAVLLSDLDGKLTETTARGQSLINFEHWWQSEGHIRAEEARQAHLKRLQQDWREQARRVLDGKEQEYVPQLEAVSESLSAFSSAAQAQRLQDELMNGLKVLPENALALYKNRLSELRVQVNNVTHQMTDSLKAGTEINLPQIEQALSDVYQEWDREAGLYVRDEIKVVLDRLYGAATRYEELIRLATKTEATTEMTQDANSRQEVFAEHFAAQKGVYLQGDFDLTISDKLRNVATPTVSALGAGFLLLNVIGATIFWPLAPIIALAAGGATGFGLLGSMTEGNRRRRASELEKAIHRQAIERENQLQQQLYSYWKRISDDARDSVSASKRQLSVLLMQQSSAQDATLADKHKALTSNIAKIDSLRRDLRWLENYEQSARLIPDTE